MITHKLQAQTNRRRRVRARVNGTTERPRLNVHISLQHITVQVIDDTKGKTLAAVSTVGRDVKGSLTAKAAWAGEEIATVAKKAKVKQVVFDRGGRLYHGRLDALAAAARKNGLEF